MITTNNILPSILIPYVDEPLYHQSVNDYFTRHTNEDIALKYYRDYIEAGAWGMGERSFTYMWKLLVDLIGKDNDANFLEIGHHRGAICVLIGMLAPNWTRYAISPMNGAGLNIEGDFWADTVALHNHFNVEQDYLIIKGLSQDLSVIEIASTLFKDGNAIDVLYIDGSHVYEDVKADLRCYTPFIKDGGLLVIDDACNDMKMPWGFFQGIEPVTRATVEFMANNNDFDFLFNVVHNRVYRKKA